MKFPASCFLFLALLFSGCASVGQKIDPTTVQKIEKGKTTRAEAIALLGNPMSAALTGDGKEMLMWTYAHSQVKGATFVPVVGLFAGGSNTDITTLQVTINREKIVDDYLFNNGSIESRMGK